MAKTANTKQAGGRSLIWLQGLACGAMAALAPGLAVHAAVLLAPAILAVVLDCQPGKPVARAIALFALAACVEPMRNLWLGTQAGGGSLTILLDLQAIGTVWSAAGAGWLLTQLLPVILGVMTEAGSLARAVRLRAARERIIEEWGLEAPTDQ